MPARSSNQHPSSFGCGTCKVSRLPKWHGDRGHPIRSSGPGLMEAPPTPRSCSPICSHVWGHQPKPALDFASRQAFTNTHFP
jgi:hypothetical protein